MTAIVKYQIGTYEGTIQVNCEPNEESDSIIARAKRILRRQAGSFPIGLYYEIWRVTRREDNNTTTKSYGITSNE